MEQSSIDKMYCLARLIKLYDIQLYTGAKYSGKCSVCTLVIQEKHDPDIILYC